MRGYMGITSSSGALRQGCGLIARRTGIAAWGRCAMDYACSLRLNKHKGIGLLAAAASPVPVGALPIADGTAAGQRAAQAQNAAGAPMTQSAITPARAAANQAGAPMATAAPVDPVTAPVAEATRASAQNVTDALGSAVQAHSYTTPPEYSWSGYFMGLAVLFIMLGMLWAGARFLKNKGALRFLGMNEHFRVESRLSLGAKKNLLVLNYHGKRLLLGVTDHHISLLDSAGAQDDEQEEAQNEPENAQNAAKTSNFRDILHGFAKK